VEEFSQNAERFQLTQMRLEEEGVQVVLNPAAGAQGDGTGSETDE
jgi:hypothetical protein